MPQISFQPSFWDPQDPQDKLMQEMPFLGHLAAAVPWENFRPLLESTFEREGKSPVGRKRIDVIIMFKLLILQQCLNCSDVRLEFQVTHNHCLRYFVGLGVEDSVPDANTVWLFKRRIQRAGIAGQLFHLFSDHLKREGLGRLWRAGHRFHHHPGAQATQPAGRERGHQAGRAPSGVGGQPRPATTKGPGCQTGQEESSQPLPMPDPLL